MNNVNVQEKIEKYQMDKRNAVTTTQLRLLLSNAVIIKNKIQVEERKEKKNVISEKLENEIKYLLGLHSRVAQLIVAVVTKSNIPHSHTIELIDIINRFRPKHNHFRYPKQQQVYPLVYNALSH